MTSAVNSHHKFVRILAYAAVAFSAVGLALSLSDSMSSVVLVGASFSALMWLASVPATVIAAWLKAPVLLLCSLVVVGVGCWHYGALFRENPSGEGGTPLNVVALNLEYGLADPDEVVQAVRASDADVLLTVEMTAESVSALNRAGLSDQFPYRELEQRPGADGLGIWSRFPLGESTKHPDFALGVLSAPMTGPSGPITVVAAHILAPVGPAGTAQRAANEMNRLQELLAGLGGSGTVIVGGDFNATWNHYRFRALRDGGFVDSVDGGGDGYLPTWPANKRPLPPLIGIDHILARGATSIGDSSTLEISGTDHRMLFATVRA